MTGLPSVDRRCSRCGVISPWSETCGTCFIAIQYEAELAELRAKLARATAERDARVPMNEHLEAVRRAKVTAPGETRVPEAVLDFLEMVLHNGCGCDPICHCNSQASLEIWKQEIQDEAKRVFDSL